MYNYPSSTGNYSHEYDWLTKSRLRKQGFERLLEARQAIESSKELESDMYLAFDFSNNYLLNLWLTDGEQNKIWKRPYGTNSAEILLQAITTAIDNSWYKQPVDIDDFKLIVSDKLPVNIRRREVNSFLKKRWVKEIFEINDQENTVRLKYLPRYIWLEKPKLH